MNDSKEFTIIEEIYFNQDFNQDLGSNVDSSPEDINFNIFYLRPIENERQKIIECSGESLDFNIGNLFLKA